MTLKKIAKTVGKIARYVTPLNIKLALGVAVVFGMIAPERATTIRNEILAPLGVTATVGDLL